jgi:hypothetical protein
MTLSKRGGLARRRSWSSGSVGLSLGSRVLCGGRALGLALVAASGLLGHEMAGKGDLDGQVGGEVVQCSGGRLWESVKRLRIYHLLSWPSHAGHLTLAQD